MFFYYRAQNRILRKISAEERDKKNYARALNSVFKESFDVLM